MDSGAGGEEGLIENRGGTEKRLKIEKPETKILVFVLFGVFCSFSIFSLFSIFRGTILDWAPILRCHPHPAPQKPPQS